MSGYEDDQHKVAAILLVEDEPRLRQMQEIVAVACGLVHTRQGVHSVHIVAATRPTFRQLLNYRRAARHDHVALSVDVDGVITIRQEVEGE